MYRTYLPMTQGAAPYYGLAMAMPECHGDLASLGVEWCYTWSYGGTYPGVQVVPMAYHGEPSDRVPRDYSGPLLVFNEPDNLAAKGGCEMTPDSCAEAYGQLREHYPLAQLVVGGWMLTGKKWLAGFLHALYERGIPRPDRWHCHAYFDYSWIEPVHVPYYLNQYYAMTGGQYWVTEYGSYRGDAHTFRAVTDWFASQGWIDRIAPYTNRQPAGAAWAGPEQLDLVGADGQLSPVGRAYHEIVTSRRRPENEILSK